MQSREGPAQQHTLGKMVLFGSGESSSTGRGIHDRLMAELAPPITVAILETPAGFQPNSQHVAEEIGEFFQARLRNYHPRVHIIPARRKGTAFSPDDPHILEPLLEANYIFLGPGSPTYAVRHLEGTLALSYLLERHREGAVLCFASAATVAVGARVLPVYEVFKAGADPCWVDGLNILGRFGLELAIVPHWNNTEGGAELDTSRCFMGLERMAQLLRLLPASTTVLGIDEHTAVILDVQQGRALVQGKGAAIVLAGTQEKVFASGESFALAELGPYTLPPELPLLREPPPEGKGQGHPGAEGPPAGVALLMTRREEARRSRDWTRADALRRQIAGLGFEIEDTREGPRVRLPRGKAGE